MPDAFLSYAREDKPLAQQLVEALESRGLEVWWDDDIEGGHPNYQRAIEDALRQATAVIVLWTPASVTSDYVREEVAFARNHKKLLPVLGKPAELPVPYRLSQTIDLTAWDGSRGHPKVASIAQALTARRQGAPPEPKPVKPTRKPQWVLRKFTWLLAPTLLTVLVLVILLNWRRPTEVAITAVVSRVEFEADGETRQPLIQQLRVPSLRLRGFSELRFSPDRVQITDPAGFDLKTGTYPESAWRPAPAADRLVLRPQHPGVSAEISLAPAAKATSFIVDPVTVAKAHATLTAPEPSSLQLEVRGESQTGAIQPTGEVLLHATHCTVEGLDLAQQGPSLPIRFTLPVGEPLIGYNAADEGLFFDFSLSPVEENSVRTAEGIRLRSAAFHQDLDPRGNLKTSLAGDGQIRYSAVTSQPPISLSEGQILLLGALDQFRIRAARPLPNKSAFALDLYGTAGELSTGMPGHVKDRRLTAFDELWNNKTLITLFAVMVWLIPTLAAARGLWYDVIR